MWLVFVVSPVAHSLTLTLPDVGYLPFLKGFKVKSVMREKFEEKNCISFKISGDGGGGCFEEDLLYCVQYKISYRLIALVKTVPDWL